MTRERFTMPRKIAAVATLPRNDRKTRLAQGRKRKGLAMTGEEAFALTRERDARVGKARANECVKFVNKQETER